MHKSIAYAHFVSFILKDYSLTSLNGFQGILKNGAPAHVLDPSVCKHADHLHSMTMRYELTHTLVPMYDARDIHAEEGRADAYARLHTGPFMVIGGSQHGDMRRISNNLITVNELLESRTCSRLWLS